MNTDKQIKKARHELSQDINKLEDLSEIEQLQKTARSFLDRQAALAKYNKIVKAAEGKKRLDKANEAERIAQIKAKREAKRKARQAELDKKGESKREGWLRLAKSLGQK